MPTASAKQISYIRSLLDRREHAESGKTITVGGRRFNTTAASLEQISAATASKLISALKASPKAATPSGPHFTQVRGHWSVAGLARTHSSGDEIEVRTAGGDLKRVILTAEDYPGGITSLTSWAFTTAEEIAERQRRGAEEAAQRQRDLREDMAVAEAQERAANAAPATEGQIAAIWDLMREGVESSMTAGLRVEGRADLARIRALSYGHAQLVLDSLRGDS